MPIISCARCSTELGWMESARLEHHEDGSHTLVPTSHISSTEEKR